MPTETHSNPQAEVRALLERWAQAIRDKNLNEASACYAAEVLSFDLAPPLRRSGRERISADLGQWFTTWHGPIGLEIREPRLTLGDKVAFCTSLQRISGRKTDGELPDIWVRATLGLQKLDGAWRIVHEHASTPFYMDGSYRAAIDLEP
jgi:PhnB protein